MQSVVPRAARCAGSPARPKKADKGSRYTEHAGMRIATPTIPTIFLKVPAVSKTSTIQPLYARLPRAAALLDVSETTIKKLSREDQTFPKPRKLSDRSVGWLVRELIEWAESRPISDIPSPQ